ncbi:MAG: permease [Methanospirillum sp.]|uniref:permease n=1 Tax=Methanospirillum sp. TaxID=45200 RepID=UPI00236C08CD|nr:permease [Methanospirillum sp.]MDD1728275.1 permease [Methanospirillum sp.]
MVFELVQSAADWIVYTLLGLSPDSPAGSSLNFFIYDTVKIFILLLVIVYVVTFLRSFFSPEKTRAWLAERKGSTFIGHILAALLGIITPFCSCSAVPLFIGFVEAGIPLGVTFTYLIAAPMVNEVALVMLYGLFGWQIAAIYIVSGEVIAIVAGLIIGRFKLERFVEDYVYQVKVRDTRISMHNPTYSERLQESWLDTVEIIKKIWLYVVIGIGIGALMHGWIPANALAAYAGKDNPFAVIVAVIIGIPLYSNAAGVMPLVSELTRAGVAMGTALAFMMAVTALSIPEMILLRKVLKPRLLAVFISVVGVGIICTGYLFNWLMG